MPVDSRCVSSFREYNSRPKTRREKHGWFLFGILPQRTVIDMMLYRLVAVAFSIYSTAHRYNPNRAVLHLCSTPKEATGRSIRAESF